MLKIEEHVPWLRIVIGLDFVTLPWLKRILHEKLYTPEDGKELYKFLGKYRAKFEEKGIKGSQREKLFPKGKAKTDEADFDITLYGFIIKVIAEHTQKNIQKDIKIIDNLLSLRNRLKHKGNTKMNEKEFKNQWKEMLTFLKENGFDVNSISSLKTDVLLSPKYVESVISFLMEGNMGFLVFE